MAIKIETTKPIVQAASAEGSCPAPIKANNKRKADEPLDNPRFNPPTKAKELPTKSPCEADQPAKPAAAAVTSDDTDPAASAPQIDFQDTTSEEDATAIIKLANECNWDEDGIVRFLDVGVGAQDFISPVFTSHEARVVSAEILGHRTSNGALEAAFAVLRAGALDYWIVIDNPYKEQERRMAHRCMDLYVQKQYEDFVELLIELLKHALHEAFQDPPPKNFEAFLQRSKTKLPTIPVRKLFEVERFRLSATSSTTTGSQIYEVELDGETLIYKAHRTHESLMLETAALQRCAKLKISAPRLRGVIGIDTKWGGILITKIQTTFSLTDYPPDTSRADRQRWFDQISEAVHALHRDVGIWGDAKPDDVLVNTDGDACLIDFEGGTTHGWVDKELRDTKEGDLQGLERIRKFLKLDE
ncbi:hypothetical protein BJX62DRAFT_238179 [Aspergillus germanicus]